MRYGESREQQLNSGVYMEFYGRTASAKNMEVVSHVVWEDHLVSDAIDVEGGADVLDFFDVTMPIERTFLIHRVEVDAPFRKTFAEFRLLIGFKIVLECPLRQLIDVAPSYNLTSDMPTIIRGGQTYRATIFFPYGRTKKENDSRIRVNLIGRLARPVV